MNPYGPHPALSGSLLGLGAIVMIIPGYYLLDSVADPAGDATFYWCWIIAGALAWLAGSIVLAVQHHVHWLLGIVFGLLPILGIFLTVMAGKRYSRQEAWQHRAAKEGTTPRRGQIRPMKPLY